MKLCEYCGCPQIGIHNAIWDQSLHFGGCPVPKIRRQCKKKVGTLESVIEDHLININKKVETLQKELTDLGDISTDACLDEVYLCRYDCPSGRLVTAIAA